MTRQKVALLNTINAEAYPAFEQAGLEIVEFGKTDDRDKFSESIEGAQIIGVRSEGVPQGVIELNPQIEAIGCFCVGTKVDFEAANAQGVALFNSQHENTRSVAEHVIGNIFNLMRRTAEHSGDMHSGTWTKTDQESFEVRRKTLGIIGYGNIGIQVSVLAESMGMDVIFHDPWARTPGLGRATKVKTREELLEKADVITLHVPSSAENHNMINDDAISIMKPGSYIINAARGDLVDYEAVKRALDSGQLGGIAVDVYADEPKKRGDDFSHVLQGSKKAILTPHIAGSTTEAQKEIALATSAKLVDFWTSGNTAHSVNMPAHILAPPEKDEQRLLYAHTNEVGALAALGEVLVANGINIGKQGSDVSKSGDLAYAYFDLEAGSITPGILDAIRGLKSTRRLRVVPPVE